MARKVKSLILYFFKRVKLEENKLSFFALNKNVYIYQANEMSGRLKVREM